MSPRTATLTPRRAAVRRRSLPGVCAALVLALTGGLCSATEVNQANEAELDSVRGFGPPTTARILQERAKAPFADWADLMRRVKGIRQARARQLSKEGLTVNGQPYAGP